VLEVDAEVDRRDFTVRAALSVVTGGQHTELGLVMAGVVTSSRPAGALWDITIKTGQVAVTVRLPEGVPTGQQVEVTAEDPPQFGPDGMAAPVGRAHAAPDSIADARATRRGQTRNGT